jgi:hypothetical protein
VLNIVTLGNGTVVSFPFMHMVLLPLQSHLHIVLCALLWTE